MKLQAKLLLAIGTLLLTSFGIFQFLDYQQAKSDMADEVLEEARAIRGLLMATRRVYHHQFLDSGLPLTEKTLGFLPAYALARISEDFNNWTESGLSFNNVSDRPRNLSNAANAIETEAIRYYREHPEAKERLVPFTSEAGGRFFHYATPIWVESYCLKCHGRKEDAPPTIRARYETAYDYQVGDLRGILSVKLPAAMMEARLSRHLQRDTVGHLAGFVVTFLLLSWLLNRSVITRLQRLKKATAEVAQGSYQVRAAISGKDELAEVATAFDAMAETIAEREQGLHESEARTRAIIESARDAIIMADENNVIRQVNTAATAMFGYSKNEVIGQQLTILMPAELRKAHQEGFNRYVQSGESKILRKKQSVEVPAMRKNGERFPVEISLSEMRTDGKRLFIGVLRDITARKQAEEKLRHYRDHLEKKVEERTRELETAMNAAEAANKAKSEFMAVMSHELRTPLNAILGFSEILQRETQAGLAEKQKGYLGYIHESGDKLLSLINDVLDVSSMEAGYMELQCNEVDIRGLIERTSALFKTKAQQSGIELTTEVEDNPGILRTDERRLKQVLGNLLSNALKFSHQGGTVNVSARRTENGDFLKIAVADAGIGIPGDRLERIFEPFSQGDSSSTRHYGGTGLGLAIVKQLTELMGGQIGVESAPGKGSTFWFTLPLASPDAKTEATLAGDVPSEPRIKAGAQILLVEDNLTNLEVARAMLEALGCRVDTALNGREAVDACARSSYDLIFMDCSMPELDGYQATRLIREREESGAEPLHVPVVALTAHAMEGDRKRCKTAGMDDYLGKPFDLEQLRAVLERWLPRESSRNDQGAP